MTLRVLVAGCGYVGTALALRLRERDHTVIGLRRDPSGLPPGIERVAADLTRATTLADLPPGLDVVVYGAAADRRDESAYRGAYVDGLRNLIEALQHQGQHPRRIVFTSSTAVYGQCDGEWVDEDSATEPRRFNGQVVLEAERIARAGPYAATVVRLGGIYGPGRARLVERVRAGEPPPAARFGNRIHRDDAAGAIAHLLELRAPDEIYVVVDCDPAPIGEVMAWISRRLGVALPPSSSSAGEPLEANRRCSNRRLRATGFRFEYPTFREGLATLLGSGA
jgi:nucleoside-diphosphate-sugar epimerase